MVTQANALAARGESTVGRVPSAAGADARRRDAGDVVASSRSANTGKMLPRRRNPKGAWGLRAISALLVVNDVTASPPPRALISPRKPHARGLLYFHHGPQPRRGGRE